MDDNLCSVETFPTLHSRPCDDQHAPPQAGAAEHSLSLEVAGFGRSGGQPARSEPILNSFCLDCYLNQDNIPTVDPRSAFLVPTNVLETPSLIDGSESPSSDEAQGAAADVSTASSQFGPGETVSDASQLAVTVEGSWPLTNFLCPNFPYTDGVSKFDSSEASPNASPSSFGFCSSPQNILPKSSSDLSYITPASPSAVDIQAPSHPLACPQCPRPFTTRRKLE